MTPSSTLTQPVISKHGTGSNRHASPLVDAAMESIERAARSASARLSRELGSDIDVVVNHDSVRVDRVGAAPTVHLDGTATVEAIALPMTFAYRRGTGWLIWIHKEGGFGAVRSAGDLAAALNAARR